MPIYWIAAGAAVKSREISQGAAATIAAAGWLIAAGIGYFFGDDEPWTPPDGGGGWCDVTGDYSGPRTQEELFLLYE